MRRRRFRIVVLKNEELQQRAHTQTPQTAAPANRAAVVQSAEPASPIWLKPSQQRLIDMQQTSGNQAAQRALGIVQRAPKENSKEEDNKLSEMVQMPEEVQGLNEKPTAHSMFADAQAAYKNKKYGTALILFRELFRQSFSPTMLINMAVCELRLDLFQEAKSDLEDVLKDDSISQEDRTRAIAALESAKKLEDAKAIGFMSLPSNVDTENSKLAKDPRAIRNHINSFYRTAESAAKSEDYDAAYNAFRIAQDRLPNPITMINIGKILVMQQRYSEAASLFEKALHDRTLTGPSRKTAEAELEAAKKFQGMRLDMLGNPPPDNKNQRPF